MPVNYPINGLHSRLPFTKTLRVCSSILYPLYVETLEQMFPVHTKHLPISLKQLRRGTLSGGSSISFCDFSPASAIRSQPMFYCSFRRPVSRVNPQIKSLFVWKRISLYQAYYKSTPTCIRACTSWLKSIDRHSLNFRPRPYREEHSAISIAPMEDLIRSDIKSVFDVPNSR